MTTPIVLALPPVVEIAPTGVQGPRGNATLTGTGTPTATVGIDGDYYIDTANYPAGITLYGPKAAGAWPGSGVALSSTAGALLAANNLSDLANTATARSNLGLGNAATRNVGTTTGTVTAGDDARLTDSRTPTQHATSHGAGGTDPVTVTQSQVTGLAAALNALAALTGATFTGGITVNGANIRIVDGQLVIDSTGTGINAVSRGTTNAFAAYVLRTANVDRWAWQMVNDGTNDLVLTDSANGVEVLRVTPNPTDPNLKFIGDFLLQGTGKAYRFRRSGSNLDFEGAGVDMILSVWSAGNFTGTQHSYDRYSADAANVQHAGRREYVTALYGAAVHTIDPDAGTASFGGKNGLSPVRFAGFKNTAGAPTTNAWAAGDLVLDSVGAWHLCTASGTPGAWT